MLNLLYGYQLKDLNKLRQEFVIDCVWQSERSLRESNYGNKIADVKTVTMSKVFSNEIAQLCRISLQKPGYKKNVVGNKKEDEIALHSLALLERYRDFSDLPLLRKLSNDSVLGESAVRAIKTLGA